MNMIEKIANGCHEIEKWFNLAGCLPFVGIVSGSLRVMAGKVQAVAGLILFGIATLMLLAKDQDKKLEKMEVWGFEFAIHGALNVLRGTGEATLCALTLGVGNVFLLIPNMGMKERFAPCFKYGRFAEQEIHSHYCNQIPNHAL
jgi:hypothetical protein